MSGVPVSSIQGARSQRGAVLNEGGVQRIREHGNSQSNLDNVYSKGYTGSESVVLWLFPDRTLVTQLDARRKLLHGNFFVPPSLCLENVARLLVG